MAEALIVEATEYTPLPERKTVHGFGWITRKKPQPKLVIKKQLPPGDMDVLRGLWEDTAKQVESERYEDQDDFENAERQMGNALHSGVLVERILKLNRNLLVEDSVAMKGCAAFYWTDGKIKKPTNASFTKGYVPEFTIMSSDTAGRPVNYPTYGWRTVLVRLLKFGALSWEQVMEVFGDVYYNDSRGKHWHLNVRHFRG